MEAGVYFYILKFKHLFICIFLKERKNQEQNFLTKSTDFRVRQIVQILIQLLISCGSRGMSLNMTGPWSSLTLGRELLHKVLREII